MANKLCEALHVNFPITFHIIKKLQGFLIGYTCLYGKSLWKHECFLVFDQIAVNICLLFSVSKIAFIILLLSLYLNVEAKRCGCVVYLDQNHLHMR